MNCTESHNIKLYSFKDVNTAALENDIIYDDKRSYHEKGLCFDYTTEQSKLKFRISFGLVLFYSELGEHVCHKHPSYDIAGIFFYSTDDYYLRFVRDQLSDHCHTDGLVHYMFWSNDSVVDVISGHEPKFEWLVKK